MGTSDPPEARGPDLSRLRIARDEGRPRVYRGFPWILVLLLAALAGLAWLYRGPLLAAVRTASDPSVRVGRAVRVVPGQAEEGDVAANGYVIADRIASLATVLSGRLVEIHAEEGDVVDEGFVVARIQFDDLEAQAAAAADRTIVAEQQVAAARADLEAARLETPRLEALVESRQRNADRAAEDQARLEREVERNRTLYETRRIDEGTWDRIQADARAARDAWASALADVRAAQAALDAWRGRLTEKAATLAVAEAQVKAAARDVDLARIQVDKTYIRAPFRGLVIRQDAELGEVIAPTGAGNSRGSVFTIVDPTSLEVQVELSERRIARVKPGDAATVFMDADPETGLPGHVRKIWPRADRTKGTIEVRVAFDRLPEGIRPEMAARVVFQGEKEVVEGKPYVTAPAAAVARRDGQDVVFVLVGDVVRRRVVRVGAAEAGRVVVEEGLEGGETVVLDPARDLVDGTRVEVESGR